MNYMGYEIYRSSGSLICKMGEGVIISRFAEGKRGLRAHALICEDIERELDKRSQDKKTQQEAFQNLPQRVNQYE